MQAKKKWRIRDIVWSTNIIVKEETASEQGPKPPAPSLRLKFLEQHLEESVDRRTSNEKKGLEAPGG
jgi:hypothetical protein